MLRTCYFLCYRCIRVHPFNRFADSGPYGKIRKDFHDAALIGKWRILQHGQILHHPVVNDIFHNLVNKIDLWAAQKKRAGL